LTAGAELASVLANLEVIETTETLSPPIDTSDVGGRPMFVYA